MSRDTERLPVPLRAVGATNLERRLLDAAAREQPSRDLSTRMAAAIGISAPPLDLAAGEGATAAANRAAMTDGAGAGTAGSKAAAGSSAVVPLLSGAVLVAVAGLLLATRPTSDANPSPKAPPAPILAPSPVRVEAPSTPAVKEPNDENKATASEDKSSNAPARAARSRPSIVTADLSDQITLVDGARSAVAAGAGEKALTLLKQYREKYPTGSFRPEVTALEVEALMKSGRSTEARALAKRYAANHGGTALAERMSRAAGLSRP